ncbi:MAG: SDR family oxidoreductase [Acidimicrobiia bacterium]|nr:SDR family oxidoreductase [Acidimicrobiia bacterium]
MLRARGHEGPRPGRRGDGRRERHRTRPRATLHRRRGAATWWSPTSPGHREVAAEIGGTGIGTDVADPTQVAELVRRTESEIGPIGLFCSNAGIGAWGGAEAPDEEWERIWRINVMGHVYAAREVVPPMSARGGGWLLNTASAAGLLTQLGSAPYSVTKHAAVGLAEWLAITHGPQGIGVSVLCPQGVRTPMTAPLGDAGGVVGVDGMLEPEDVATTVVEGLADERFLILPHPEVAEYFQRKANDHERWIPGMQRLQARLLDGS